MPKDTKSLGNNKAPACESRGFVHKKEGVHFDTPSFFVFSKDKLAPFVDGFTTWCSSVRASCDGFTTRCRKVRASPRRLYYTV